MSESRNGVSATVINQWLLGALLAVILLGVASYIDVTWREVKALDERIRYLELKSGGY